MQTVLRNRWGAIRKDGFVRSVGVLMGGTVFAQAITVLVLPLLTRLYRPEDFSILAVYAAVLAIISVVACLRLEIAIPLPGLDEDAANLLALALLSSAGSGLVTAMVVMLWPAWITECLKQPDLRSHLWLLPLGVWLTSSYAAIQFWVTRKKGFAMLAKTRVTQSALGTGTQLGMGWLAFGPIGLLLGQLLNSGAGAFRLGYKVWQADKNIFYTIHWAGMRRLLKEYEKFPRYSVWEALANNAGIQLPMLIIAALVVGPEAGYLFLATRIMASPISLIGGAVAQVYLSHAPEAYKAKDLGSFTVKILGGLMRTGVGPLLFIGIVAPLAFPVIFGSNWHRAGELVAWMTPWFIMQLLSSPVSMSLHVTGNQSVAFLLQMFGFILRVAVTGLAVWSGKWISEAYAISGFVFYFVYNYVILKTVGSQKAEVIRTLGSSLVPAGLWVGGGLISSLLLLLAK
ncbi:lipopolysaccharide biosynthesis protein [Variovorax paradoxus]|uniref:lipopolysaccharide biosynthesis protein n=1 Tax=Variovorax paradoxus TaxID=34073 RepID=UPI003F5127EB